MMNGSEQMAKMQRQFQSLCQRFPDRLNCEAFVVTQTFMELADEAGKEYNFVDSLIAWGKREGLLTERESYMVLDLLTAEV
jgi:hypothetical protein